MAAGAAPAIGNTGNWINDYATAGPSSVNPSSIASRMSPYMNAYVMQSLQPQLEAQDQQFAGQNKSFDSAATGAGAFGDSSYNLGRTNLTNQQNIGRTGLVADAYQRAFNTAIGAGAQDVSNDINAQTTNASLREQQLGREATGANAAFGMGTGATNLTNSLGGQQTAADQARLNAQYNEFLRQQYQDPQFRVGLSNSTLTAANGAAPTTTTTTAPNNAGYGLIGAGLGAAGYALGGPIGGMVGSGIGSMFGPSGQGDTSTDDGNEGYADGGRPPVGKPVLVGERGPEVFHPDGANANGLFHDRHMGHRGHRGQTGQPGQPQNWLSHAFGGGAFPGQGSGQPTGQPSGIPAMPPGFGLMGGNGLSGMLNPAASGGGNLAMPQPTGGFNGGVSGATPTPSMGGISGSNIAQLLSVPGGANIANAMHINPAAPNSGQPSPAPSAPGGLPSGLTDAMHSGFGLMGGNGLMPTANTGQPATQPTSAATTPTAQPSLSNRLASLGGFGAFGMGSAKQTANAFGGGSSGGSPAPTPSAGTFNMGMSSAPPAGGAGPKLPGFAEGGDYPVDQPFEVGERGVEEIDPDQPGSEPIIVGKNGPEVITMKEPGTVIPHEALTSDNTAEPPLFLKSGTAAPPQPPQPAAPQPAARSPMRGTAALGNPRGPSPAQQDMATLQGIADNPGDTVSNFGLTGGIVGNAIKNKSSGEPQPLGSPKPKPETKGVPYPNSSSVFDLISPNSAAAAESHDPRPVQEIPEPTEKEGKEIARIGGLITAKNAQLEKKIKASKYANPNKDPDVMSIQGSLTSLQADLARVEGPGSPLGARRTAAIDAHKTELSAWNDRQANIITSKTNAELPYAQKYPERQSWIQENMPKVSAGTGLALGLLGKGKMVAPAVKSAVAGGFEGAGTAAWPALQDTEFLPPGGNWKDAAGRLFNGDESSKDFWKRVGAGAITHGGLAVGASGAGSAVRDLGGQLVEGAKSIRWPKPQAAEAPPNSSFAPPAGAPAAAAKAASAPASKTKGTPEFVELPDGSKLTKYTYDDGRKPRYHQGQTRISEEDAQKLMAPPPRAPRARPPIQAVQ